MLNNRINTLRDKLNQRVKMISQDEAWDRAKECEWAEVAIQPEGNEINWVDAGNFYLEGYNRAVLDIAKELKEFFDEQCPY